MKYLCFVLFLFFSSVSVAQEKDSIPPSIGIHFLTSLQNEDIFSFLAVAVDFENHWSVDAGLGYGWRRGGQSLIQGFAAQMGTHYDFCNSSKIVWGPAFRLGTSISSASQKDFFVFHTTELGYHFSFGQKWKVIQSSYLGLHHMRYRSEFGKKAGVSYLGYSLQLGFGYAF